MKSVNGPGFVGGDMKSICKVILLGAVGQDPEVRYSASGLPIASFSLATSEKRKDKDEVTQWHSCVAFGKLAEIVQQYVTKGSKLYVDGAIDYQVVERDGVSTKYTKIIVNELSMLSSTPSSQGGEQKVRLASVPAGASRSHQSYDNSDIPF